MPPTDHVETRRTPDAASSLYPPTEPFDRGLPDVGDGHRISWEICGNPSGSPAVVLHGGPGTGRNPTARRFFDPDAYRIVLFDQRGSGASVPHAGEPTADLRANTTEHLVGDIERLRRHLGIDRWLVLGGSWGSTLGLAYAQRHPARVAHLVLSAVTASSRGDVEWITQRMARLLPAEWARFRDGVPPAERGGDLVESYYRLLTDPDPAAHVPAARNWCDWEVAHMSIVGPRVSDQRFADPRFRLGFTRLVTHYWRRAGWLADGVLLGHVDRLAGIPGVLIHGRRDISSPPDTAWQLAQSWPDATFVLVDDAGHGGGGMTAEIVRATDRFRLT